MTRRPRTPRNRATPYSERPCPRVAPPEEAQRHVDLITQVHDSEAWQQVLEDQGWTDSFITGDEFGSFLDEESQRVEGVLSELGLT